MMIVYILTLAREILSLALVLVKVFLKLTYNDQRNIFGFADS